MKDFSSPIGIFDSGYGGLTVFRSIVKKLPSYDYLYLGDNARAPYGHRSHEQIYEYTWQAIEWLFAQGCPLVILACNTASARALRAIQQKHLQAPDEKRRVLGVIRPTAEVIGSYSKNKEVGILGTQGTIESGSYPIEIGHFFPEVKVYQKSCPMWVPIIEEGDAESEAAHFYVEKYLTELLAQNEKIDTLLLGCTHYPLLLKVIQQHLPPHIKVMAQGELVAASLAQYLQRHKAMQQSLSAHGTRRFFTTGDAQVFDRHATMFFGEAISSTTIVLS